MMNKPMMGQVSGPATPGQPSTLNFQSDPGMRSQFKGFMSGMAARNMPAPMPQPAMMMPQVPSQLANVDVFQPVQGFFRGGSVDRSGNSIPGDYAGGQGPGRSGGFSGSGAISGGVRESGGARSYSADDISFGEDQRPTSDPVMDALSRALATTQAVNEAEQAMSFARQPEQMAQRTELQRGLDGSSAEQLAQMNRAKQAAIMSMNATSPEIQSVGMFGDADGVSDNRLLNQSTIANLLFDDITGPVSRPSTLVDYSDPTEVPSPRPAVSGSTPMDAGEFSTSMGGLGALGEGRIPSGPPQVGDMGAMGEGAFPSAPEVESIMDRAARKDVGSGQRMNVVTQGRGAGMAPMDQIEMRSETDLFDDRAPGIGGMIQEGLNKIAQGVSGKVMEKVQAGGTPVYDANNQIVGVYDQSGLFGGTVYTGLPGFENPALASQISAQPGNESAFSQSETAQNLRNVRDDIQDAGSSFLKLLGF